MNDEFSSVLCAHAARYAGFEAQDAVKLAYQYALGAEHLAPSQERVETMLLKECADIAYDCSQPMLEEIGGGLCRVHLRAFEHVPVQALARLFVRGASCARGDIPALEAAFRCIIDAACTGDLPFSAEDVRHACDRARESGYAPVRHSERFRALHVPAYRVMPLAEARVLPLCEAVQTALNASGRVAVALDGRCASGKTTLCAALCDALECPAVHMDDFFLPPELRTPERFAEPGGNIHYERFLSEVAAPLRAGAPITYRVFACSCLAYSGTRTLPAAPVTVVEGSYSAHPKWRDLFSVIAFVTCEPQTQRARILARNGAETLKIFERKWIPMEETYIISCCVDQEDRVIRIDTSTTRL